MPTSEFLRAAKAAGIDIPDNDHKTTSYVNPALVGMADSAERRAALEAIDAEREAEQAEQKTKTSDLSPAELAKHIRSRHGGH